jgi:hypothetical protein
MRASVCLVLLLFFSVGLASCPPVASQGHNYYFLPVPHPNTLGFYMDDVLPSGPLMECASPCEFFNVPGWPLMECTASCNFFTRPFANTQKIYGGITAVIYVEYTPSETQPIPQDSVRLFYCAAEEQCHWGDYIVRGNTPIAFQVTAQTLGITFEKGSSLNFRLAYDYPTFNFSNFRPGSFRILFGDSEHRSSVVTQELNLEGEPVPEFPLPVLVLLSSLVATYAISTRRRSRAQN